MKDHEFRELVNALRDVALQYHDHESLRERIRRALSDALKKQEPIAWADDKAFSGDVGNVASAAAKAYWEKSNWADRESAKRLRHPLYALAPVPQAPSVPDGWGAGVRAVVRLIDQKAEQYACEFGHDDMGGLSFGRGERAEYKMDYYTSMLELADEVRGILAASPLTVCAACERAQKDYAILERVTDDLAVLVQRLVRCLRKAAPDSELPDQATDYLRRKGLQGSPLRDERVTSNSIGVEAVCVVVDGFDGKRLDWLIEGGLDDLPEGATLIFAHQAITDADGWGEVFLAAPHPECSE